MSPLRLLIAPFLLLSCALSSAQTTTQSTLRNPPAGADRVLLVTLGVGDSAETDWSGEAQVERGEIVDLIGYEMGVGDLVEPPSRWQMSSRPAFPFKRRPHDEDILVDLPPDVFLTPRFHIYITGAAGAALRIETAQGAFEFALSDIPPAGEKTFLNGRAKVSDSAAPILAGRGHPGPPDQRLTDNDFSSVTVTRNGATWVAWQGFDGEQSDRVFAERLAPHASEAPATPPHAVSPADGDVYRTAVAEDSEGKIWVVWSEQRNDNWDLYARSFDGEGWSRIERLTDASQPDTQHKLLADSQGRLTLVWQGYRDNRARIWAKTFDAADGWSAETEISNSRENC